MCWALSSKVLHISLSSQQPYEVGSYYFAHLTDEDTEALKGSMTFPRSLRWQMEELGFNSADWLQSNSDFESSTAFQCLRFHCFNETHACKFSNQSLLIKRFITLGGRGLHWDGFNFRPRMNTFSDVWDPAATQQPWAELLPATLECELTDVG